MSPPLNEVVLRQFEQYLMQIALAPKTIESYLTDLDFFVRWVTEYYEPDFSVLQITSDQIRAYLSYLQDDLGRAPATINRHLQALRKYCAYIVAMNLVTDNATDEIALIQDKIYKERQTLSGREVNQLLVAAGNARPPIAKRDWTLLALMIKAGLRVAEVANLQMGDIVFDYPGVHLTVKDSRGQGQRDIPLPTDVCRGLKDYLQVRPGMAQSSHVFLTQEGKPLSARTVQRIVTRCTQQANLPHISAQGLRRTYAMNLLAETGAIELVKQRLGHKTEAITVRYLQLEDK